MRAVVMALSACAVAAQTWSSASSASSVAVTLSAANLLCAWQDGTGAGFVGYVAFPAWYPNHCASWQGGLGSSIYNAPPQFLSAPAGGAALAWAAAGVSAAGMVPVAAPSSGAGATACRATDGAA